jgi:hypothetical protein
VSRFVLTARPPRDGVGSDCVSSMYGDAFLPIRALPIRTIDVISAWWYVSEVTHRFSIGPNDHERS